MSQYDTVAVTLIRNGEIRRNSAWDSGIKRLSAIIYELRKYENMVIHGEADGDDYVYRVGV